MRHAKWSSGAWLSKMPIWTRSFSYRRPRGSGERWGKFFCCVLHFISIWFPHIFSFSHFIYSVLHATFRESLCGVDCTNHLMCDFVLNSLHVNCSVSLFLDCVSNTAQGVGYEPWVPLFIIFFCFSFSPTRRYIQIIFRKRPCHWGRSSAGLKRSTVAQ